MGCPEQVDLQEYLEDPSAPRWEAFRAHYPRCRECANEVRAWGEVVSLLSASEPGEIRHPRPELLVQFAEQPGRMNGEERSAVSRHVDECRSCADELSTFRGFDFAALEATSKPIREPAKPTSRPTWLEQVGEYLAPLIRVAVHPAFTYALIVLALIPTIARYQDSAQSPQMDPGRIRGIESEQWKAATLTHREPASVRLTDFEGGLILRVIATDPSASEAAVAVTAKDGHRAIHEQAALEMGVLELRLPRLWLQPGQYDVEVRMASVSETYELVVE